MNEESTGGPAPLDELSLALRWGWLIAVLTVLGGMLGWGIHAVQPPLYEARAVFGTSIDYVRTGALTDIEEDQAIAVVGDVLRATDVRQSVQMVAQDEGLALTEADFGRALVAERMGYRWLLRVRLDDPQRAARVAQIWAAQGQSALQAAALHAQNAALLARQVEALGACLKNQSIELPAYAPCPVQELPEVQAQIAALGAQLAEELRLSRGLPAALTVTLSEEPTAPQSPAQFGAGTLVGAGGLLGLLAGVALVWLRVPQRLRGAR